MEEIKLCTGYAGLAVARVPANDRYLFASGEHPMAGSHEI